MCSLKDLQTELSNLKNTFIVLTTKKEMLEEKKERLTKEIESYKIDELEVYNVVMQKMAERQRQAAATKLEFLATCALQYAVSPSYTMKINIEPVRKKPNAEILIRKDNGVETDPSEGNGGGIIDISSMALRIITLESYEPFVDGPIILDEPGKMVSKEYVPMLSEFLKKISIDFDRQIILVTHNDFLSQIADKKLLVTIDENSNESSITSI